MKGSKLLLIASCLFFVLLASLNIAFAFVLSNIIDSAIDGSVSLLLNSIFIALVLVLLEFSFSFVAKYLGLSYSFRGLQETKNKRFWFSLERKDEYRHDAKKDLSNFSTDADLLSRNYYNNKPLIALYASQFVFSLLAVIYINWILAIAIIGVSVIPFIVPALLQKYVQKITFYDPCESESEKLKLLKSADVSHVSEFAKLPDGLNREITNASGVSGGQKQRIALARALYRGSDVLILDEATSGIELETARNIMSGIFGANNQLTCIVITHQADDGFLSLFDDVIAVSQPCGDWC